MADAPAPQIALQPAPLPGASETAAPVYQTVPVAPVEIPDPLAQIARPVQIGGLVVGVENTGAVEIQTSAGNFILSLFSGNEAKASAGSACARAVIAAFIKDAEACGKKVTLFLEPVEKGQPKIALCLPKEGKTAPHVSSGPARLEQTGKTPSTVFSTTQEKENLASGKTLTITVLPERSEKAPFIVRMPSVSGTTERDFVSSFGSEFNQNEEEFRVKGDAPPLAVKSEPQAKEKVSLFFAEAAKAKSEMPVLEKIASPILKEGQETRLAIVRLAPQGGLTPHLEAGQLLAEVAGRTQTGKAVLTCEGRTLLVHETTELPEGTRLVLAPISAKDREVSVAPSSPREREIVNLRELVATLAEVSPQLARAFVQDKLPTPGPQLGGTLLFLLSAIQGGKIEEWIGNRPVTQIEKANKKAVIDAFVQSLEDSKGGTATDSRVGEWRVYPIPLHDGQKRFDMLRLYVREGNKENSRNGDAAKQTHFLIAMDMSRLGPMQMDGLSRPGRLDLVVRSERALPENLPSEIKASYLGTLDALGLAGSIAFQTGRDQWVFVEEGKKSEGLEI